MSTKRSSYHDGLSGVVKTLMKQAGQDPQEKRKAYNATRLAEVLEQERPNISAKINGSRVWSLNDFLGVAEHYGVSLDTLLKMMNDEVKHQEQAKKRLNKTK